MIFNGAAYQATIDQLAAEQRDAFDEHQIDLANPEIQKAILLTAQQLLHLLERPPIILIVGVDGLTTMLKAHI